MTTRWQREDRGTVLVSCVQGGNVHVYKATPKGSVGGKGAAPSRYFARAASEAVGRGKRYFMEQVKMSRPFHLIVLCLLETPPFSCWKPLHFHQDGHEGGNYHQTNHSSTVIVLLLCCIPVANKAWRKIRTRQKFQGEI